jgi:hypothetical protein
MPGVELSPALELHVGLSADLQEPSKAGSKGFKQKLRYD